MPGTSWEGLEGFWQLGCGFITVATDDEAKGLCLTLLLAGCVTSGSLVSLSLFSLSIKGKNNGAHGKPKRQVCKRHRAQLALSNSSYDYRYLGSGSPWAACLGTLPLSPPLRPGEPLPRPQWSEM